MSAFPNTPHVVLYCMYYPENKTLHPCVQGTYPSYTEAKKWVGEKQGYTIAELKPGVAEWVLSVDTKGKVA